MGWNGEGESGTIRQESEEDPGSEGQKFIRDCKVLVPLNERASPGLVSASFLRLGVGERARLITD